MAGYQYVRYDHRKHLEALFKMMMDPEEQTMFLTHSISNSLRDFDNWLQDRLKYHYHDFFVVESDKEELIGIVYSYDHRMQDGHCKMTTYITQKWRHIGLGSMVGLDFIGFLFRFYPYRRINCDVYRYNIESFESLKQAGFEVTGHVKEYRYFNGKYHDLMLLTMSREYYITHWAARFAPKLLEEK